MADSQAESSRMAPWWQRYPERWIAEQAAMSAAGLAWAQDPGAAANQKAAGTITITAGSPWTCGSQVEAVPVRLAVQYPDAYPWFPPAVIDADGDLAWLTRHRDPTGTLCLIAAAAWNLDWTLADLLKHQLPRLLLANSAAATTMTAEELADLEVPEPEPRADSYRRAAMGRILVDGGWPQQPDDGCGALYVAFADDPISNQATSGVVKFLYSANGEIIGSLPNALVPVGHFPVYGQWITTTALPVEQTPEQMYRDIADSLGSVVTSAPKPVTGPLRATQLRRDHLEGRVEVIGLVFPDETTWRAGATGQSWLFLIRTRSDRRRRWTTRLVRAAAAGPDELSARAPDAAALASTKALIVGIGSIGSRITDGLARAGVGTLTLIDCDSVEPGNLVRHAAPFSTIGAPKALAMMEAIHEHAPLATVTGWTLRVGGVHLDTTHDAHAVVVDAIEEADICIDATADPAVSRYLAAHSAAQNTSYVNVSATGGGWGGVVVHIRPGRTAGCWSCLLHHRADRGVPFPPADPGGYELRPTGCTQPTFTGAAADLETVALHAVRVITHGLSNSRPEVDASATSDLDADLHIAALRDEHGRPHAVRWVAASLERHPDCPLHAGADIGDPPSSFRGSATSLGPG